MAENQKNQGEGDRESARRYNEHAESHARSGKSDQAAREAREDVERDRESLRAAEKKGKERTAEEDPEIECTHDKLDKDKDL